LGTLQIEGEAFLIPIDTAKEGRKLPGQVPGPGIFHLDHFGSQIGQEEGAVGTRELVSRIQYFDPLQGKNHDSSGSEWPIAKAEVLSRLCKQSHPKGRYYHRRKYLSAP
jgi:hypothetical protein